MSDFSLTTLIVVPVGNAIPSTGSRQDLAAGQVGFYLPTYAAATAATIDDAGTKYFYVAQGRANTYLQGTKSSDKIAGYLQNAGANPTNVTEFYKVAGCPTPVMEIWDVSGFNVKCGDVVTLTIRAHSSYLDTLYFNGLTRSVTVQAPCCDCGGDPCDTVDESALVDAFIKKLGQGGPGTNPDNLLLSNFFTFKKIGAGATSTLRIEGKALTAYAQPCDVSAFPHEYDRMWFRVFVYAGPATTADFIVADNCDIVATSTVVQRSSYATGTPAEIKQLEKDLYSYQAGYLKHLYTQAGYNGNFESFVSDAAYYDLFYIKFNDYDKSAQNWGDYVKTDQTLIIACPSTTTAATAAILVAALGPVAADNACLTTTSSTTTNYATTTTTTTLIP